MDDNIAVPSVYLLAFWYTNQSAFVRWNGVDSGSFSVGNGTRQGSVLSPYLFTRYIREVITVIAHCAVGCNITGVFVNILAYADDIVLLAPSWKGLLRTVEDDLRPLNFGLASARRRA